jgi:manganese/zinc/iron transport system substrate-binding protein
MLSVVTALLIMGCGAEQATVSEAGAKPQLGSYKIVCTTGMIADVVRNIVGEHAEVSALIPTGVDPHLYKPTRKNVLALSDAQLIFYNGVYLEGKMIATLETMAQADKVVVPLAERAVESAVYIAEGHETDPHLWMDVALWNQVAATIAQTLCEYDPTHVVDFETNLDSYARKLRGLDAYAKAAFASIPTEQRVLVTAHDAFNYMGRAYNMEVKGIQGLSTESEAGLQDLENLVSFIVERQLPAVFVESSVADKNVRALVEGAQAQGHQVVIGGTLFSDAMGPEGTYEGTYVGMIDHNVSTIVRALGGVADGFAQD